MIRKKEQALLGLTFVILFIGLLVWAALPAPVVEASLPSRDTPTPIPPPAHTNKKDDAPVDAWLELQAQNAPAGAWGVVQWQNSAGGWEDVAGWQGPLPENSRWWVAAKDFGAGPFRWRVTQGQGGTVIATSAPFTLPSGAGQLVRVTVGP